MAPKSAAALILLLAAMIAGLAPPLQAQINPRAVFSFLSLVDNRLCSGNEGAITLDAMQNCADQLARFEGAISLDCCRALLKAVTSGDGTKCVCGVLKKVAILGFDVDQSCQAASNGSIAGGPSKLTELCMRAPGN